MFQINNDVSEKCEEMSYLTAAFKIGYGVMWVKLG